VFKVPIPLASTKASRRGLTIGQWQYRLPADQHRC